MLAYARMIYLVALLSLKTRLDRLFDRVLRAEGYEKIQELKDDLDAVAEEEGFEEAPPADPSEEILKVVFKTNGGLPLAAWELVGDNDFVLRALNPGEDDLPIRGAVTLMEAVTRYGGGGGDFAFWSPRYGYLTPSYAWYAEPPFV